MYERDRIFWLAQYKHKNHKGESLDFENYQFLRSIYFDKSEKIVIQKSTQAGVSEYLHVKSFEGCSRGRSIFYVLPTYDLMLTVVQNRIDKEIAYTQYYKTLIGQSEGRADSAKLKHIGNGVIKFVGSNTANAFIEFPADDLIVDELDRCDRDNIIMAVERLGNAVNPTETRVSNPTIPDFGINREYNNSDRKKWMLKCLHCRSHWFNPDFFVHVVRKTSDIDYEILDPKFRFNNFDSELNLICDKCEKPVDRYSRGEWVAERDSPISGYHVNKLFSSKTKLRGILEKFIEAETNMTKLQRFYNSDLGLSFLNANDTITQTLLNSCKKNYTMPTGFGSSHHPCLMGVDVGTRLHCIIAEIHDGELKIVYIGTKRDEKHIIELSQRYKVIFGVIDALPETRLSIRICKRLKWFRAMYGNSIKETIDKRNKIVTVSRTTTLDTVKEYFLTQKIMLPKNADTIPEFYDNMTSSVRMFNEITQQYKWVEGSKADHYLHSTAYLILAYKLILLMRGR